VYVAVPGMFFAGTAWITVANSLTVSARWACPTGCAPRHVDVPDGLDGRHGGRRRRVGPGRGPGPASRQSLAIAAATSVALMALAQRWVVDRGIEEDLTPSSLFKAPMQQPRHAPGASR